MTKFHFLKLLLLLSLLPTLLASEPKERPNVILIITDDQGYGEMSAHGHPYLETPHMDRLHGESVRMTDFHVDSTCSPTRAALLTGRYSTRTGVWHTINGRSMMRTEELTMAEVFQANGYATAMLGKWHIGANYPFRPSDQGFEHTIWHKDGAIGGIPDYWGNDYYDDTYMTNGEWQQYEGYCTDVWFEEATKFVEAHQDEPFFLYLSTNAPHGPYIVDERYSAPFMEMDMPENLAKFYGMIVNIDENLGKFRQQLEAMGVADNTLLIFMTDNGTTAGWICQKSGYEYYNAGMRGWKSSAWEGGHRVPIFWHWPEGGLTEGRDIPELTAHIDVLPTLVEMLDLKKPEGPKVDGISLSEAVMGTKANTIPDRTLYLINGPWAVDVAEEGLYEISLYRWPPYLGKAMGMKSARLRVGDFEATKDLPNEATEARFLVKLNAGPNMLQTWLERTNGDSSGAYYLKARHVR
ncbi:MAG: arylsulfatase [Opitutales bacterium]